MMSQKVYYKIPVASLADEPVETQEHKDIVTGRLSLDGQYLLVTYHPDKHPPIPEKQGIVHPFQGIYAEVSTLNAGWIPLTYEQALDEVSGPLWSDPNDLLEEI